LSYVGRDGDGIGVRGEALESQIYGEVPRVGNGDGPADIDESRRRCCDAVAARRNGFEGEPAIGANRG